MTTDKIPQTLDELQRIASDRLKKQPGLEEVAGATINLDEDGRWTIGLKILENADVATINRGRKAVEDGMRDEFNLKTDT